MAVARAWPALPSRHQHQGTRARSRGRVMSILAASLGLAVLPKHVPEFMRAPLMVRVAAGLVGIVSGFIALFAVKGETLHRTSGKVFVYAMVVTGPAGGNFGQ